MPDSVMIVLATGLVALVGYLLGSVPVADLVARRHGLADLRDVGDRNPGYWNAREQLGVSAAVPVFVGDVAKGALAAGFGVGFAAGLDGDHWWLGYVGAGAAMVGHAWPLFARWSGGRSVLTWVGATLVVATWPALVAVGVLAVVRLATGSFAWAARAGVIAFPFIQLAIEGRHRTAASGVLMTFIGLRFLRAWRAEVRPNG